MENILNWVWLVLKHFIWISVSILYHLVATDDKKKIQCLNVVLNNKTEPLHVVLEFNWCRDTLYGDQSLPLIGHESVCKRQRKNIPQPPPRPTRFKCLFRARTSDYIFVFYLLSGWLWGWCLFFLITPNEVVIQLIISPWVLAREIWLDKRRMDITKEQTL